MGSTNKTTKTVATAAKATPKTAANKEKYVAGTLAIAVARSMNSKIGDAATTYAEQRSCPTACPFFDGGGCYAEQGRLGFSVTAPLNRAAAMIEATPEDIARAEAAEIDAIAVPKSALSLRAKKRRPLRLHTLGDCKTDEAAAIVAAAAARYAARGGGQAWTYTHAWRDVRRESWGDVHVLASCETPEQVAEARARGYAAAIVVEKFADRKLYQADGLSILPCPAQTKKKVTCASCRLCMNEPRLYAKELTIAFEVHGTPLGKRKASLAITDPNNPNRKLSGRVLIPRFIKEFRKQHGRAPKDSEIAKGITRGYGVPITASSVRDMRVRLAAEKTASTP